MGMNFSKPTEWMCLPSITLSNFDMSFNFTFSSAKIKYKISLVFILRHFMDAAWNYNLYMIMLCLFVIQTKVIIFLSNKLLTLRIIIKSIAYLFK